MKLRLLLFFFTAVFTHHLIGQNLVPNYSFEEYDSLPCDFVTDTDRLEYYLKDWFMPTNGSTDIFSSLLPHNCYASSFSIVSDSQGSQNPRSGTTMSALNIFGSGCNEDSNYREYISVKLKKPLQIGKTYFAEMYVCFAEASNTAANNLGMYFSEKISDSYRRNKIKRTTHLLTLGSKNL